MASISPPTSLVTFQTSHASSSKHPHVTLTEVVGSTEQVGVAAVQGDGVWTYDLQTVRPTGSFTVPPSTVFSTSPISFYRTIQNKDKQKALDDPVTEGAIERIKERLTCIGIQKGDGIKKSEEGRVIWMWRGDEGSEKQAAQVTGPPIQHLIREPTSKYPLIAIQGMRKISLFDQDFKPTLVDVPLKSTKGDKRILAAKSIHVEKEWKLLLVDESGQIAILKVGAENQISVLFEGALPAENKDSQIDLSVVDISPEGSITAITKSNLIINQSYATIRNPTALGGMSISHPCSTLTLLSLPSTSTPLTLIPSLSPPSLVLTANLSDSFAVISTVPIQLGSNSTVSNISILSRTSQHQFIIGFVVSHKHAEGDSGRSIIYTCEVNLPVKGIGMNTLMGTQARTDEYFSRRAASREDEHADIERMIDEIELVLQQAGRSEQEQVDAAEELWRTWVKTQDGKVTIPERFVKRLVHVIFGAALPQVKAKALVSEDSTASEEKLKRKGPYARGLVKDLLERGLLGDQMWPGGLISNGLLPCGDWDLIPQAITLLPTLSSSSVIKCLISATHLDQKQTESVTFESLYAQIIDLPPPPTTWRLDMRRQVTVDDATMFLEQLSVWAEKYVLAQGSIATWDGQVTPTVQPGLSGIITHATLLLDSHLPLFLSHPPSYPFLEKLQASLAPLIAIQADYRALRGPIDAVLTLAAREERNREEREFKRDAMRSEANKKGKSAGGKGVPIGRLPTAGMGKWRVEDFVF